MTYKKEFLRDMSFVDGQGNVVIPSMADLLRRESASVGKAYGFFQCSASKQEIERELPTIRKDTVTPRELELSLMEGMDNVRGDKGLTDLAQRAKTYGMNYMLEATYPGATNEQTSGELQALLINTSNSLFCETNEHIDGRVVYEENGQYVFRD